MSNSYGQRYRFTIFGQSHAPAVGVTIEGLPAGFTPDRDKLAAFLARRAPGKGAYSTTRKEEDVPEFVSGLAEGHTCGAPVTVLIRNTNARSGDYANLVRVPRPGHADYAAAVKYGESRDVAGGGQFSGRLTAPLCVAGGLALQLLEREGIRIEAQILSIGGYTNPEEMEGALAQAKERGDSLGGVIECQCTGIPAGLGEPMFGGMENRIAQAVFAIPAVKGVEFGAGFAAAAMKGSENNDPFYYDEIGAIRTRTNHAGGILGGITSGMPVVFRAAFKPTPSIGLEQDSVDLVTHKNVKLVVQGRHDPCIVLRAVPCVEAAAAAAVYDALLESRC